MKKGTFSVLLSVSIAFLVIHFVLNYFIDNNTSIAFIVSLHSYFIIFLLLMHLVIRKKIKENYDRMWVFYVGSVSIKFFSFLAFLFLLKYLFEIEKDQVLLHVFLWFFLNLIIEVVYMTRSLNQYKEVISKN